MASDDISASGMSVLELLFAITMLMLFSGVVAAVMEVTLRFAGEAECPVDVSGVRRCNEANTNDEDVAHGVLIERQRVKCCSINWKRFCAAWDSLFSDCKYFGPDWFSSQSAGVSPAASTAFWTARVPELPSLTFPRGYHVCLWRTGLREASMENLLDPTNNSDTPGLYVLQALPTQLNASTLPIRRLLCRPRPFC